MGARDECEQIAEDARDGFNSFWNGLPTFWPAKSDELECGNGTHTSLPKLVSVFTPYRFHSMYGANRDKDHVALSQPLCSAV